ncbi:hypothetical protein L1987_05360 [Smallanthus sonchifolius]|uniref:Uncharacterized protein n=1 Tax=Smallanthus sonchifolius TaxID=185202 RepID=A0ACB9JVD4_9ASTR|nr:hypothetical protein L1987_05360 [Smallanthus sonchifolius]
MRSGLSTHPLEGMTQFNGSWVYQQSISAVCIQDWPRERMLVQVLDDSNDTTVQALTKAEVNRWQHRGVHIVFRHRLIRTGYKARNLKSAMSCDYVNDYEFVAIFYADFQPVPDFLKKAILHFKIVCCELDYILHSFGSDQLFFSSVVNIRG